VDRHRAEFEIPADLHDMGDLRRRVREVLAEWDMHRCVVDAAVQTAHEMAVAAMTDPAQGASTLRLALTGEHLRVEVSGAGAAWSFPRGR
jgi:hypothetical protein